MSGWDESEFHKELGELIYSSRKASRMSRKYVCERCRLQESSLRRVESGEARLRLDDAIALDSILDFGLAAFMKSWSDRIEKVPQEIFVRGVKYRLVA